MAKHLSIKTVCVSIFILFLAIFGCFQNISAESLSSATGSGSDTTTSGSTAFEYAFGTTVDVTNANKTLVVASFMMEMDGAGILGRDATFQITDNNTPTPDDSGIITRRLQRVDGNDKGIGSLVHIFDTSAQSGNVTYTLQHSASSHSGDRPIKTSGTIVAIPLVTDSPAVQLQNDSSRVDEVDKVDAPDDTFAEVTGTPISITTTVPGDYYVAASVQSYKYGGNTSRDAMGEWKMQYCSAGSCTALSTDWNDLGYTVSREISNSPDDGIMNMTALLPQQSAGTFQFRLVHRKDTSRSQSNSGTIVTTNTNLVAVYTGFHNGSTPLYFPIYSSNVSSSSTSSTGLSEAVGFDFIPITDTDLFLHSQYWMEATGFNTPVFDLFVDGGKLNGQDQQRLIVNSTDAGSGASVGLAQDLLFGITYRVSLRHAVDPTGPTLTTNNPTLIMWDLNTDPPSPDLSVSKACSGLIPGQNDALIYTITISNSDSVGTETSPVSTLEDIIPAGVPAGSDLTNIKYVIDAGIPPAAGTPWPATNTINLPSIAPGDSVTVRIYADVPYTLTNIGGNTATVILASDSDNSDNSDTCSSSLASAPTSTRAMEFDPNDSTDDYVSIADDNTLDLTTTGTLEAWIYPEDFATGAGIIHKGDGSTDEAYSLRFGFGTQNDQIQLIVNNGTADTLTSDTNLNLRQWYHVAGTWDGSDMAIFIDGIPDITKASSTAARNSGEDLFIGAQNTIGSNPFDGIIDEARVWSTERGITDIDDIRDYMCQKVESTDPPYSDLVCYLRFDEDFGPICGDTSGNGNIGIITNAVRICSEAPIGDDSSHDYAGNTDTDFQVPNFPTTNDNKMTITGDGGSWDEAPASEKSGLQVYWVDGAPQPASGTLGSRLITSQGYWGVFVTGGVAPTYSAIYNYNDGGIKDENELKLMFRHKNCQPWRDIGATLNIGTNTLTYAGLSGTEFILGANVDPRNAITYDGTDDHVAVADDTTLDLGATGTIEAWINITAHTANGGIIHKGDLAAATDEAYYLRLAPATNQIVFGLDDGTLTPSITSATALTLGIWYHIAGVWNSGTPVMNLYINGVLDQTAGSATPPRNSTGGLNIGAQYTTVGSESPFNGLIDEVQVWNSARTQIRIRDTMCHKITNSESDFANLMGYWRFDEETDSNSCPDYSSSTNTGAMFNFGTTVGIQIRNARVCSSAPIGDDSNYAYYDSGAISPISAQLAHPDGDYMFATENSGTWNGAFSGIQIYLINEAPVYPPDLWDAPDYPVPPYGYQTPNGLTPPTGWSSIDYYRYWGVFVTDPVNEPSYDLVYNYNGNPMVPVDDTNLGLARRPEYCFGTWSDSGATLNSGADTLSISGDSLAGSPRENPEYVLGGKDEPLAITLVSFNAVFKDNCIKINWETATEIDTRGFQLWRSASKDGPFTLVQNSFTASKSVTETQGAAYTFIDCNAVINNKTTYYYKLEDIDLDTETENPLYGPIGPVTETVSASQFASTKKTSSGSDGCFINSIQ